MILVGGGFNNKSQRRYGLEQSIDDDRKVALFLDDHGTYMLIFVNGQQQKRVALSPEAAEAAFELLGTALSGGKPADEVQAGIHTCSYACDRPACIRAQRDELVARLEAQQADEATVQ